MIGTFKVNKYVSGLYLYDTIFIKNNNEVIQIPVLKSIVKENLIGKEIEVEHKDGIFDCAIGKIIFRTISFDKK